MSGIVLGRKILVLGFNHNIQSSFGVTTKVIQEIRSWIAEESEGYNPMRPGDRDLAEQLAAGLFTYDRTTHLLLGIRDPILRMVFVEQLLESIRRVKYFSVIRSRKLSERSADPNDEMFDPLKASILHHRKGQINEAFWLVFLFVHFGKHNKGGWRYVRDVYGRLGEETGGIGLAHPSTIGFREWFNPPPRRIAAGGRSSRLWQPPKV